MKVGFILLPLACALVLKSSLDTAGSLTVDACRLGFTQNFYTVFISWEQLQGHTITRVNCFCTGASLCVMLTLRFANTPEHMAVLMDGSLKERITFQSSNPKFSVRPDGSLYAEQDVKDPPEPIRFTVTARGSKDTRMWTTIVKLVITRHQHHPLINRVSSHHNHYHNLSQHQRGFSTNGLHWQTRDRIIPPIRASANSRRAFPWFLARLVDPSSVLLDQKDRR
ncbi:hypothetical protein KOW79_017662 [Hemibagrus wyckioides]|uniref:Cadherin prodomain domain-containing protein n=1 Tax=Hemibagrus wyckioides TaxID=337641 RepID=A0A9D3SH08_9TELE|nr:hypothetical protein KOW79_017662 [Hemibagrus wyckioides]